MTANVDDLVEQFKKALRGEMTWTSDDGNKIFQFDIHEGKKIILKWEDKTLKVKGSLSDFTLDGLKEYIDWFVDDTDKVEVRMKRAIDQGFAALSLKHGNSTTFKNSRYEFTNNAYRGGSMVLKYFPNNIVITRNNALDFWQVESNIPSGAIRMIFKSCIDSSLSE